MKYKPGIFKLAILLTGFQFFTALCAKATDEKYAAPPLKGTSNQITKDSFNVVQDTVFYNLALRPTQTTSTLKNFVTFKLDEYANISLPDTFKVTITFKVYFSKIVSGNIVLDSSALQTLFVEYNKFRNYQNKAVYTFTGGVMARAQIFSVTSSSSSGTFATYKNALILENEIQVTREYVFDPNINVVKFIVGVQGSLSDPDSCSSAGEYVVAWGKIAAADEYDLEWTYIDSSAIANYYYPSTNNVDPKKIFFNNASRVSITSESYQIPILYDNGGILFFRVRPVRVKQSGQRIEGAWSSNYGTGLGRFGFAGHERSLNWQASTSYAEDGKRKSVVQYFDGVLKSRQTVTKDNNTCFTVVAETLYDYQGRPVIQVMPAPTLNRLIGYTAHFNRDVNGADYDKSIYDKEASSGTNNCNAVLPGMGTMSGASLYYSSSNTIAYSGFSQYIPNAWMYPFAETRYTPDNTGRVAMQGGVGFEFQVNKSNPSHDTKYFYGSADQEELDALFGTEVGNASHYSKNMVRDANGQYSVSYVDMHGRTIATALAGQPQNSKLDSLSSSNTKTIVKRLLDTTNNIVIATSVISSKALIVTKAGLHRFQYSLIPDSITVKDCNGNNICYDCLYDLEISISNDCVNPNDQPITIRRNNVVIDTACNQLLFSAVDTSVNLSEGSYLVTKKLTISQSGLDKYNEIFLRHNTCRTQQQFIDSVKTALLARIQCYPTCQSCVDSLGTWNNYRTRYMFNNHILTADTADFREQALIAYQEQARTCDDLCSSTGLHSSVRAQMLTDMTAPYGQYAEFDSSYDSHNIFHTVNGNYGLRFKQIPPGSFYKDEYGRPDSIINNFQQKVPPTDGSITAQNFLDNFKDAWAETLLPLHPEYCRLLKYDTYATSHIWDERFSKIETFRQAKDSGFLNPSAFTGMPSNGLYNSPATGAKDPFFTLLQTGALTVFKNSLLNYVPATSTTPVYSAWSLATIMAHCDSADAACLSLYQPLTGAFTIDTSCRGDLDFAWRYFREMYLNNKAHIVDSIVYNSCADNEVLPWHTLNFNNFHLQLGSDGLPLNVAGGNDSLDNFINDNCHAYVAQWMDEMRPCNLTASDSDAIITRLINVCKAGGNTDHIYGSSTTKPGTSANGDTSFIQVLKSVLGNRYDSTCNAYLITAPKPYDKQTAYGDIEIWDRPDSCQCSRITSLYQQFQSSADASFSDYVYRVTGTRMYPGVLDTLRMLCNGQITCRFLENAVVLPPALQCNVANTCVDCASVSNVYGSFKTDFPGIIPSENDVDSVQQTRNRLFENYMNQHLGFSKKAVEYLNFLDTCGLPVYVPHADISGCDTTIWKLTTAGSWNHIPSIRLADYIANGIFKIPVSDIPNSGAGLIKNSLRYADTLCVENYFVYENRIRFPIDSAHLNTYVAQGGNSNIYGSLFHEFHFNNNVTAFVRLLKGKSWHPLQYDSIYATVQIVENGVTTSNHALLSTGLKDLSGWQTIRADFRNGKLKTYLNGQLLDQANCNTAFSKFYNLSLAPYGFDMECDWVKMYDTLGNVKLFEDFAGCGSFGKQTLPHCASACSPLDVLIAAYQKKFINPDSGYVDYDLRTFAGNLTPDAGPKGVFDVNNNLIGNTVSGTVTQIKQSYAQVWNSSAVNQLVGSLSLLANGKFRLKK